MQVTSEIAVQVAPPEITVQVAPPEIAVQVTPPEFAIQVAPPEFAIQVAPPEISIQFAPKIIIQVSSKITFQVIPQQNAKVSSENSSHERISGIYILYNRPGVGHSK